MKKRQKKWIRRQNKQKERKMSKVQMQASVHHAGPGCHFRSSAVAAQRKPQGQWTLRHCLHLHSQENCLDSKIPQAGVRRVRPRNPDLSLGVQSRAALLVGHGVRRFDSCNISPQGIPLANLADYSLMLVCFLVRYTRFVRLIVYIRPNLSQIVPRLAKTSQKGWL